MDDLFKALQMFQTGVSQAATTAAVNDAAQQMNNINSGMIEGIKNEGQKRQALQGLANNLALQLTGAGADASHIQQAFNAVNPTQFGSAEQLQLEGSLSGNKQYQQSANQIINQREQQKKSLMAYENQLRMKLEDRKLMHDMMIAGIKKPGLVAPGFQTMPGTTLTEKDTETLKTTSAAYMTMMSDLDALDQMVQKKGTETFGWGEDKALMQQTATGIALQMKEMAKLGALSGPDMAILEKLVPDPTVFSSDKFFKQSENFKERLKTAIDKQAQARGVKWLGDKSISDLTNSSIQVRTLRDGTRVKVIEVAPGKYQKVD